MTRLLLLLLLLLCFFFIGCRCSIRCGLFFALAFCDKETGGVLTACKIITPLSLGKPTWLCVCVCVCVLFQPPLFLQVCVFEDTMRLCCFVDAPTARGRSPLQVD